MADVSIKITADDQASKVIDGIGGTLLTLGGVAAGVVAAGIGVLTAGIGLFVEAGIPAIATYEKLGLTLESLVAREKLTSGEAMNMADALAQASGKGAELLDWTQQLAIHSPFTQEGVAEAFRMALAYGFTTDEAKRLTEAMIDFASGTGANEDSMRRIALALGQIEAKGKLAGQEVLQLVNAGLPVTQILAEAFNKTTAEIVEMQQSGLLPAQDVIEAITVYLETNFAGAAERTTNTWAGLLNTFQDLKAMALREFFGGLADALQPLMAELSLWLQGPGLEKLHEWGTSLGNFATSLIALRDTFASLSVEIGKASSEMEVFMALDFTQAKTTTGNAFLDLVLFWKQILGDPLRELGATIIQAILDAFVWGKQYIGDPMREFAASIWQGIVDGIWKWKDWVGDPMRAFGLSIIRAVREILGIASPSTVFAGIGFELVQGLIMGWVNAFGGLLTIIKNSINAIISLFPDWLLNFFGVGDKTSFSATATATAGGGTSGTLTSTATQNYYNYYYGNVYFSGTGQTNGGVDCQYPNSVLNATASAYPTPTPR